MLCSIVRAITCNGSISIGTFFQISYRPLFNFLVHISKAVRRYVDLWTDIKNGPLICYIESFLLSPVGSNKFTSILIRFRRVIVGINFDGNFYGHNGGDLFLKMCGHRGVR
jgi:hypothetical protein